jgi:hypothetical protein
VHESEAEPSSAVIDAVRGIEGVGEEFTKAVNAGDASPGQLGVRDVVVCERLANVDGGDVNVVAEMIEEFVGGRGLFGNTSVGEFEEWLRGRGVRHGRRRGRLNR